MNTEFSETVDRIAQLLKEKNAKYGNSALEPCKIFTGPTLGSTAQICVRIDDKLSRIRTRGYSPESDEDTLFDLIGYLILLHIASNPKEQTVGQWSGETIEPKYNVYSPLHLSYTGQVECDV